METEIKFRAWDDGVMIYSHNNNINHSNIQNKWFFEKIRKDAVIMQFTGLTDKNGKEIYSGDIVKYFKFSRYVQQSHFDINPEINEPIIVEKIGTVDFIYGAFVFKEDHDEVFVSPISNYGLYGLEELQKLFEYEEGVFSDVNGNEINESILGLEVIGNLFEHPELLK